MGFNVSWLAIHPGEFETIKRRLGQRQTGQTTEFPFDTLVSAGMLPSGWCHVALNAPEHPLGRAEVLARLSSDASVIRCQIEEHCMFSSAESWLDGERAWRVVHDLQRGLYDLEAEGAVPASLQSIHARQVAKQQAERASILPVDHIFEVPLLLARDIVGFKHDGPRRPDGTDPAYSVLVTGDS